VSEALEETHPEMSLERGSVRFIQSFDRSEGVAEQGVVIVVDAFFDALRRFMFIVLVGCYVGRYFFCPASSQSWWNRV
jgi:hypothetical protein